MFWWYMSCYLILKLSISFSVLVKNIIAFYCNNKLFKKKKLSKKYIMQIAIILWQIICLISYFSQTNLILLVKNKLNNNSLKGK